MSGKNDDTENKSADEKAEEALMKACTLSRDVSMEECHQLVKTILESAKYAPVLPVLICHLRNHEKSLVEGQGSGERNVAERLAVALYLCDDVMGRVLFKFLVLFGSWKSLLNILCLCDALNNPEAMKEKAERKGKAKTKKRKKGANDEDDVEKDKGDEIKLTSAAESGPYMDLCHDIHDYFVEQLRRDKAAIDAGEKKVSNASKYAPHERRGRDLTSLHADEIAKKIFPNEGDSGGDNKHYLRKLYRKLRSQLNQTNEYLPDRKLALGKADQLQMHQITAGYFAKSRKALLNRNKDGQERYDSEPRRNLRRLVLEAAATPQKVPTPSDLQQLATDISFIVDDDDEELILLQASFEKAVMVVTDRIHELQNTLKSMMTSLSMSRPEELSVLNLDDVLMAIDVSPSQAYTFPLVALLVILFHTVINKLKEEEGKAEAMDEDGDQKKMTAHECVLFHQTTQTIPVPVTGTIRQRLSTLVKSFREARLTVDGQESGENEYTSLLQTLKSKVTGRPEAPVLVCSDFASSPEFAIAVEEQFADVGNELCCWKLSKPTRIRNRKIVSWDSAKPQIDLCICLDTTGSMGSHIESCKSEILNLLNDLMAGGGMAVSCSFVSYKDFTNAGHLETHDWVSASDAAGTASLRRFITGLRPTGGDDWEEDVAGGFEKCIDLMKKKKDQSSLKLVLLIADAPAHGYPDGRPNYNGVDQKERLRKATRRLAAAPHNGGFGCELMFAEINPNTTGMCDAIDKVLEPEGTYIDQFEMGQAKSSVFREKIVASVQQVVSHAVAPPAAVGLDVISGTDIGICERLLASRLSNRLQQLLEKKAEEEKEEEEEDTEMNEDSGEAKPKKALPTALGNLLGKLDGEAYNMVRHAMGTVKTGLYASYQVPTNSGLSEASVLSLIKAGITMEDLIANGYPKHIQDMFEEVLRGMMTQGAGKING
ncbi:unnamed protein product [Cylindrotheca closterium]|uniref:DUF2828 domain-containing protein n=1 Tax=Cylindrotheca closterium TaxID=2856 RepID=A0AAD2FQP2_9STRA|nr:unnamed protein product [Cylindrotheca closterium]